MERVASDGWRAQSCERRRVGGRQPKTAAGCLTRWTDTGHIVRRSVRGTIVSSMMCSSRLRAKRSGCRMFAQSGNRVEDLERKSTCFSCEGALPRTHQVTESIRKRSVQTQWRRSEAKHAYHLVCLYRYSWGVYVGVVWRRLGRRRHGGPLRHRIRVRVLCSMYRPSVLRTFSFVADEYSYFEKECPKF